MPPNDDTSGQSVGKKTTLFIFAADVRFKIKKELTRLQDVFDAYANRKGLAVYSIRFTFKGSRVHGGQTASSVGMADGDRLDVEDAVVAATEPED